MALRSLAARTTLLVAWLIGMLGILPAASAVRADELTVAIAVSSSQPALFSLASNQTIKGLASADEDILYFDGQGLSLFFDGSDVGAGKTDLVAFSLLDPDTLLFAFNTTVKLGGISVQPQDIVRFDAASLGDTTTGAFSVYFDGSDVGLTITAESLDALSILPDGRLLISTTGNPVVRGVSGADEDVLAFTPESLGRDTRGKWSLYFDGSDVGLANTADEDVDAFDVTSDGAIYLSTLGSFSVRGVKGADEDVFVCMPTSTGSSTACNYSPELHLDGSKLGLASNDVDAFHALAAAAPPTHTPTSTRIVHSISLPANLDQEQGNFGQYTSVNTDGGDLTVSPRAGLAVTAYGLSVLVDDSHRAYAYAAVETASTTGIVRARFYIDPNSLRMDHLSQVNFLYLINSDGVNNFASMKLMRINGRYFLRGVMVDDNGVHRETGTWPISDEPHYGEIQVRRASSATSNDGAFETWIDGERKTTMTGVDSYNKFKSFQYISVGLNSVAGTVSGIYYVDEIAVNDDGREIGPVSRVGQSSMPLVIDTHTPPPPTDTPPLTATYTLSPTDTAFVTAQPLTSTPVPTETPIAP